MVCIEFELRGANQLVQVSCLLNVEGTYSPKRVGYLGLKDFHGPGEPDASLGKLGSRKFQKMTILPPPGGFCFQN